MFKLFEKYRNNINELLSKINIGDIARAKELIQTAHTVYIIGNGGSATIASHFACDLVKRGYINAISLCNDSSLITAIANDIDFSEIYRFQLRWKINPNYYDILVAISSSGESKDIINAVLQAKHNGCKVITLSGFEENNSLSKMGNVNIHISSNEYGIIENCHNIILHFISDQIALEK